MRAPVSVLIPTLNAADALPGCLAALGPGLQAGLLREVVISDGGSQDATPAIAQAAGAIWVAGAAGRGGQLRRGAQECGGDWLLILHADSWLDADWPRAVAAHIAVGQGSVGQGAGWFRLGFRAKGPAPRLVAAWANLRSRAGLPYGDQGLLIARADYDAIGGYQDIPLMEDVAIARALRGRLRPLAAVAWTDAGKYRRQGWLRRGSRNLWLLVRYLAGADPRDLARVYGRS